MNAPALPQSVCFRVTRACNARCSFCLAPPDGEHPDTAVLTARIDWLLDRDVRSIHFCGGEPTVLRACDARVKVSLHGPQAQHDALVGRRAFDATVATVDRMVAARVRVAVQATVVAGGEDTVDWLVAFCQEHRVRHLSLVPFLPRGRGREVRSELELEVGAKRALEAHVKAWRRRTSGRLRISWLDFSARPIHVVEADGRLVLEGATEVRDEEICRIAV